MSRLGANVRPARASDLRYLAKNLRASDVQEIAAMTDMSVLSALSFSYRRASVCMVAEFDGKPEAIWGAGDLNILTNTGAPWMLCTDRAVEDRRFFMRVSIDWRDQLSARYAVLKNMVDCRNTVAIRWLKWLGFTFSEPFEMRGHRFMVFEMRRNNVR